MFARGGAISYWPCYYQFLVFFFFFFGRLGVFWCWALFHFFISNQLLEKNDRSRLFGRFGYAAEEHLVHIHVLFFFLALFAYIYGYVLEAGIANHCHANDYLFF